MPLREHKQFGKNGDELSFAHVDLEMPHSLI